jgi:HTH-type transcriptional regulator/antitoxin HigA
MSELKYTVTKSKEQYKQYCSALETLDRSGKNDEETENEIELLVALIKLWDIGHVKTYKLDPVKLLSSFIADHQLKEAELLRIMDIHSRGHLNDILNYKKGLSKKVIRRLADYFEVSQEAFNRPYSLKVVEQRTADSKSTGKKAMAKRENLLRIPSLLKQEKIIFQMSVNKEPKDKKK